MTTTEIDRAATCYIRTWGCRVPAYADAQGLVRVYDEIAGYYTAISS